MEKTNNEQPNIDQTNQFMREKIKERPVSKRKLFKKKVTTASMAVLFGLIACCTFMFLQPALSRMITKQEEKAEPVKTIVFPEVTQELEPEEMLSEKDLEEAPSEEIVLEETQIQEILSEVTFDLQSYVQMYDALSEYVAILRKSMVTITCTDIEEDWMHNVQQTQNQCYGVVIANSNSALYILTSYQAVKEAEDRTASFQGGIQAPASILGYEENTDIAVLTVDISALGTGLWENNISIATLGSSNSKNLETTPVIAMGMPTGVVDSVGYGMITSTGGSVSEADVNYKILQTDIVGATGVSGVLFNMKGEILGILKGDESKTILSAYGITDVKKLLEKLSNKEAIAYLGIKGTYVSQDAFNKLNMPYGAYVEEVVMNSPAMQAGIQSGDVITEMNGQTLHSFVEYTNALYTVKPQEKVILTVYRLVQGEYKIMSMEMEADEIHQ